MAGVPREAVATYAVSAKSPLMVVCAKWSSSPAAAWEFQVAGAGLVILAGLVGYGVYAG